MAYVQRKIPAPTPTPDTVSFWKAAEEGKFLVRKCSDCGKAHWYPRVLCPHCFSDKTDWHEAAGTGVIYSVSVMLRAPEPYASAYVTLAEGTTMLTNIVECDFEALKIGMPVKLHFVPTEGGPPVPCFTPA